MNIKLLCCLAGAVLLKNAVFAADSLDVKKEIKIVTIGPQEINPIHLLDPAVVLKMEIEQSLNIKNQEADALKKYREKEVLKSILMATETSDAIDLEITLEGSRRSGDRKAEALVFSSYGVYYGQRGELEKSIQYFTEALKVHESLKNKSGVLKITENLAALYQALGKYAQAIKLNLQFVQLCSSMGNTAGVAKGYLNVAENKLLQKEYAAAESYILNKSLYLFRRTGNKAGRMKCFQSLASLYFAQQRYTEAKWFNLQANIMAEKLDDREAHIENLIKLAEVKVALGEIDMAISDFKLAEIMALKHKNLAGLAKIKGDLGEIYHSVGDYKSAGDELDEYSKLSSSLFKPTDL
ncbi:tetratricopeptide repeat protein [Desertivirga xinjiangensis]|uniref:tetratricopeptide repeat protein n=1 Tax=Desertivirga xinjiangensis TaxID=539206 RepID=UPI00210AB911|nr:tetratricopeptide repeat protein [Pedobacter xinjiangensis]